MNPCSKTSLLTAYLLGELSEPDAAEVTAHLATCAECGKTAAELRATVELMRETLAPAEESEMRFDDARRRALLEVRPQKENWFVGHHRRLAQLAAEIVVVVGILGILSASLFPAGSNSSKAAKRVAARRAKTASKAMDGSADINAPLGVHNQVAAATLSEQQAVSWLKPSEPPPAPAAAPAPASAAAKVPVAGKPAATTAHFYRKKGQERAPVGLRENEPVTTRGTLSPSRSETLGKELVAGAAVASLGGSRSDTVAQELHKAKGEAFNGRLVVQDKAGAASPDADKRPEAASSRLEPEAADMPAAVVAGEKAALARELERPSRGVSVNPFIVTVAEPFSTFAIDVDTASYTLTRQALRSGAVPEPEVVRTEEIVNAFDYGDAAPEQTVFRVYQDGAQSPFGAGCHLLRIGVKGRRLGREEQRPAMLTFVIDVSGSMSQPDRIGLARGALRLLAANLSERDSIQLVVYSDHARVVLEPVAATEKARIVEAFERLQCNGSTNLEEGLRQAYEMAARSFMPGAENRVILISDGVANLGADSAQEILGKVDAFRRQGITCSVFGVGAGTYNDRMLEELANKGDGVYRFLDSEAAVRSAFVDDLAATLNTIAKDAKIQVEWNPAVVRRYRQLGYENRALRKEQFRDDAVDAGEVGSGQSVTALYELELVPEVSPGMRLGTVRIRYQRTDSGKVEEIQSELVSDAVLKPARAAGPQFKVAASAAEFAELLRGSPHAAGGSYQAVADYLRPAVLELHLDVRVKELLELITIMSAKHK